MNALLFFPTMELNRSPGHGPALRVSAQVFWSGDALLSLLQDNLAARLSLTFELVCLRLWSGRAACNHRFLFFSFFQEHKEQQAARNALRLRLSRLQQICSTIYFPPLEGSKRGALVFALITGGQGKGLEAGSVWI